MKLHRPQSLLLPNHEGEPPEESDHLDVAVLSNGHDLSQSAKNSMFAKVGAKPMIDNSFQSR